MTQPGRLQGSTPKTESDAIKYSIDTLAETIRDYTEVLQKLEIDAGATIGRLRMHEHDLDLNRKDIEGWEGRSKRALEASRKYSELGDFDSRDKFDALNDSAVRKLDELKIEFVNHASVVKKYSEEVEKLKYVLFAMRERIVELNQEREELVSRAVVVRAIRD